MKKLDNNFLFRISNKGKEMLKETASQSETTVTALIRTAVKHTYNLDI